MVENIKEDDSRRAFVDATRAARRFLTPAEVAEDLGCSVKTVRALLANKELRGAKLGGQWFVAKAAIDALACSDAGSLPRRVE